MPAAGGEMGHGGGHSGGDKDRPGGGHRTCNNKLWAQGLTAGLGPTWSYSPRGRPRWLPAQETPPGPASLLFLPARSRWRYTKPALSLPRGLQPRCTLPPTPRARCTAPRLPNPLNTATDLH